MTILHLLGLAPLLAAGLVGPTAQAQGVPWSTQDAYHEESADAGECSAYYTIIQQCLVNSDRAALAAQVANDVDRARKLIVLFGQASGTSEAAMIAFLKMAQDDQLQSMNESCMNAAVIVLKYSSFCKALLEHPDTRLMKLLAGPPPDDTP